MRLDIHDLVMTYDDQNALDGVSVTLRDIHSMVIIGPSGGGKSTLLRVLAGLEKPNRGSVNVNETDLVFEEKWLRGYRKRIGVVFQAYNLFPHWTALRNITVPLTKVHAIDTEEADTLALDLMAQFGLADHAHKTPAQLSGGQQQRIAIARALAIEPEILLLDEPTSALDPQLTHEVLDMILALKEQRRDLVLVTHEMAFARISADYVLYIDEGKLVEHGPAEQLFEKPQTLKLQKFLKYVLT